MMIGLPASGKTTWVQARVGQNPEKKYNVLSTYALLDKMKVLETHSYVQVCLVP